MISTILDHGFQNRRKLSKKIWKFYVRTQLAIEIPNFGVLRGIISYLQVNYLSWYHSTIPFRHTFLFGPKLLEPFNIGQPSQETFLSFSHSKEWFRTFLAENHHHKH